jgi:glycosyltransferase involved in cell wall biosynthesis
MCTYNSLPFVKEAVADVLAQTCGDFELVIGDDGSTDGTREWLQTLADSRIVLHLHERNLGYVHNKNYLHRVAKGEYLCQQDGDDRTHPERLERQFGVLRDGSFRVAGCDYFRIDGEGRSHFPSPNTADSVISEIRDTGFPLCFPALMVHRSVFDRIGLFSDYFNRMYGDDCYWSMRATEHFPIYNIAAPLYGYRENPGSLTNALTDGPQVLRAGVLKELQRVRRATGSDPIERGDLEAMRLLEADLRSNRRYMSGQLRAFATRLVDWGRLREGGSLLLRAWRKWPLDPMHYRTAFYLLRRSIAWAARR